MVYRENKKDEKEGQETDGEYYIESQILKSPNEYAICGHFL